MKASEPSFTTAVDEVLLVLRRFASGYGKICCGTCWPVCTPSTRVVYEFIPGSTSVFVHRDTCVVPHVPLEASYLS